MNAYKFYIWTSCYWNDKFSHTSERTQIIHAHNKIEAEKKLNLKPEKCYPENGFRSSKEFTYEAQYLGTVKSVTRTYYQYSLGKQHELLEEEYHAQLKE